MSRFHTNTDTIDSLDFAATDYTHADFIEPTPCKVPRADQVATCPPHAWVIRYDQNETVTSCRKCPAEKREARFDIPTLRQTMDASTRGLIREAHNKLKAIAKKKAKVSKPTVSRRGRHDQRMLTDEQVRAIRTAPKSTPTKSLARLFNVRDSTISGVRDGDTYKDVV